MPNVTYQFDSTGLNPDNLIKDEIHTLNSSNSNNRIIIPKLAPFYLDNFKLYYLDVSSALIPLIENVDYQLVLPYVAASRSTGKMVYGGIVINNNSINGTVVLSYQIVGGNFIANSNLVMQQIMELNHNPKVTYWDAITNIQTQFPSIKHSLDANAIGNYKDLIDTINSLADSLVNRNPDNLPVIKHLIDTDNPHHTTKEQIGLGNVPNLPIADQYDLDNLIEANKFITVGQALFLINKILAQKGI